VQYKNNTFAIQFKNKDNIKMND